MQTGNLSRDESTRPPTTCRHRKMVVIPKDSGGSWEFPWNEELPSRRLLVNSFRQATEHWRCSAIHRLCNDLLKRRHTILLELRGGLYSAAVTNERRALFGLYSATVTAYRTGIKSEGKELH